jgi:hypothetical protein
VALTLDLVFVSVPRPRQLLLSQKAAAVAKIASASERRRHLFFHLFNRHVGYYWRCKQCVMVVLVSESRHPVLTLLFCGELNEL